MKLIDKDGKPLNTEGIDPKVVALMTAGFESLSGQVGGAISASLKPVEERMSASLAELSESVGNIKPAEGDPAKPEVKAGETGGAGNEAVLAAIAKIGERLDTVENQTKTEREAAEVGGRTKAFFDKHFPNLKGRDVFIARVRAAKPKNDEEVKAEMDKIRAEQEQIWGKETVDKTFAADATAEGAKQGQTDDAEAQAKAKIEAMDQQLKNR